MYEIDRKDGLMEQMLSSAYRSDLPDITFVVAQEKIPAHRVILATRSEYFRALLYGGLEESHQSEITLHVPLAAFKAVLGYIYTGHIVLSDEYIGETFDLAHQYGIAELEAGIIEKLQEKITLETVLWKRSFAELYGLTELLAQCDGFIDCNAEGILKEKASFNALSEGQLQCLLQRDTFKAKELNIFLAVQEWCECHPDANVAAVTTLIRLPLIDVKELVNTVWPSNMVDASTLVVAIQDHCNETNLKPRHDAETDVWVYDLKCVCLMNLIKAKLQDQQTETYMVQVSQDQSIWYTVVDYRNFCCSSHQHLRFPSRLMRYIRFLCGSSLKALLAGDIEVSHTSQPVEMHGHIIAPVHNVALASAGAAIAHPINRNENDPYNDNFNSGNDQIINYHMNFKMRFGQPYYIGSISIQFLSDLPHRYNVLTSTNGDEWTPTVRDIRMVANVWQHFTFRPRIVMFIHVQQEYSSTLVEPFTHLKLQCPSDYLKKRELQEEPQ